MIKLLLEPVNFLILDEPTNHLDIQTKDILKEAIQDFNGTVIVVSHDRYFLDGLVDKVYEFGGGKVIENLGGIYEFLQKKNLDNLQQLELSRSVKRNAGESEARIADTPRGGESKKLSYAEQKERAKALSKAEKTVKNLETEISRIEAAIQEYENKISAGDASSEVLSGYEKSQQELEKAMADWEKASEDLEELKNS